jgi:WXXGXW repeat (2 copies)
MLPLAARGQLSVSVNIAPPPLPVYQQPPLPAPGYIWVPGYWAYGPEGYFWVPGTWVEPPGPDLVWTPGYWSWSDGAYAWTPGYWGPTVGYYGGIDYGYGYPGRGYYGGEWRNHQFFYNSAVDNVRDVNVTNVYSKTVVNNVTVNRVSYNGGPGGVSARPTAAEQAAARAPHHGPTSAQIQHVTGARGQHDLLASVNHGSPPIAATAKPNTFSGPGVVKARGASVPPAAHNAPPAAAEGPPQHPTHLAQAPQAPRPEAAHPPARPETPRPEARPAPRPEAAPPSERPQAARPPQERETRPGAAERPEGPRPQTQQRAGENTARHEPARKPEGKPEEHRGG